MQCSSYITFLDLANAFRSISHQLTHDMLTHIQLPPPVVQYLSDVCSKLQAFVSTPDWNTDAFAIQKVKEPKALSAKPHCAKAVTDDLSVLLKPAKCLSAFLGKPTFLTSVSM